MVSLSWRSIFSRNFDLILPSFFFNFAFLDLVRPGWDTGFLPSFSLDFEFDEWVLFFVVFLDAVNFLLVWRRWVGVAFFFV